MRIHFPFKLRELFFVTLIPLAYAVIAFATIGHYGVSFDEPPHFRRGQAYLHFFLTGKKDYSNIPSCIWTDPEIASVGLSEEEAKTRCPDLKIARFLQPQ